jgi:hypothetical protein
VSATAKRSLKKRHKKEIINDEDASRILEELELESMKEAEASLTEEPEYQGELDIQDDDEADGREKRSEKDPDVRIV